MATRMQQRRGTAAQWVSTNGGDGPILNAGEIGFESDTGKFKVGDGVNHWVDLEYFLNEAQIATDIEGAISDTEKGAANGVASLDSNAKLTSSQIPATLATLASPTFTGTPAAPTANAGTNTTQIATTAFVISEINNVIDGAPAALNTLNELAAALSDDQNYASTIATALSNKQDKVQDVSDTEISYLNGVTSNIQTQLDNKSADNHTHTLFQITDVTASVAEVNVLDGITVSTAELNILDGVTASTAELNILDGATLSTTELNYVDGVTSAIQTQLDGKSDLAHTHIASEITDITASAAEINLLDGVTATTAEINLLDGVTATTAELNILDGVTADYAELNILDGATVSTAELNILDGATLTTAELNYVDGVTSAIQTQLNGKASSTDLSNHESSSYNVHGITDTSNLVTKDGNQTLSNKTLNDPVVSGKIDLNGSYLDMGTNSNEQVTMKAKLVIDSSSDLLINVIPTSGSTQAVYAAWVEDNFISRNGQFGPTTDIDFGSKKITNLGTPTDDSDAATKAYVDAATAGLNVHDSVKAATTANITLASDVEDGDIIDGVTLATGNRILIKDQSTKSENGVYIVNASGAPTRATDYDSTPEVDAGDFIFVESGTVNAKTGWVQTNTITTIGTDDIEFTQFSGAGTYTAGTGLTLTGNTFSINTATTVDTSTAQTLTNKTLTSPVISTISNTGTVTLPTSTDTLVGRATTDTLTNKTINLSSNTVSGTVAEFNTALSDGDFATLAGTETLSNKTLSSPTVSGTLTLAADPTTALQAATKQYVDKMSYATAASGSATYSVTTANANKLTEISHSSEVTVTVPSDASDTDYPIGTTMDFRQMGAGRLSFVWTSPATKVSTDGYTKSRTQYSVVTLEKRASNAWIIYGDIDA